MAASSSGGGVSTAIPACYCSRLSNFVLGTNYSNACQFVRTLEMDLRDQHTHARTAKHVDVFAAFDPGLEYERLMQRQQVCLQSVYVQIHPDLFRPPAQVIGR